MISVLFVIQILCSIFLPLWLYIWISKTVKKYNSSCLDLKQNIPQYCINWMKRREKNVSHLRNEEKRHLAESKIKDKDSANSVFFYGTDQKGNSLTIKFTRRAFKIAEISLQLATSDGRLYVLPEYPETTLTSSLTHEWTAGGLRIEFLDFQQRWRIIYNGMLRNLTQGDECNDDNVEHVRFNFIFIAYTRSLKWPEDWSSKLHAEALACDPWKSHQWINKIKLLEYKGFDQWGSMLGQVTYKDGSISSLYLRGLHQHRWGKHESYEFYESVTLFGIMLHGAMYYLNMSSTKHSFPQIQLGQYRTSNESQCEISKIGLKLSDFKQGKLNNNLEYKTWFIAENKRYDIIIKPSKTITLYYGQPWNSLNKIVTVNLEMNGKTGVGLLQLWSLYNGPHKGKTIVPLQLLKQLSSAVQKNDYFVVPRGFCVTVFALELQLRTHKELQKVINDIENVSVGKKDGDLQKYCNEAMRIIESTPVVDEVKDSILKAIESLESENSSDKPSRYAIRSSAVGEDSEETSAAGQNSTYLSIQGEDNIVKSVAKCWASLFSYQSVKYRKQHGMFVKTSMGVCVQRMVNADAAGVMFTRHPTTGDPSNILITANYGLGESVVSATVEPDTIIVHKSWDGKLTVKSSLAGNKQQKILSSDNGVVTIELNEQENKTVCLSEQIALRLAATGMDLEMLFGSARDIEWAVVNENIYLLQARPITTLYTWTDFELTHELDSGVPSDIDMFTFANVGEVFPYPLSPLAISMTIKILNHLTCIYQGTDNIFFHIVGMRTCLNYYNTFLRQPSKTVTLLNKVSDIGICGHVIITPEIMEVARERNGESTRLDRILLLYKMVLSTINNGKIEKTAKKIRQDLNLNIDDYHTAYSLYNKINQRKDVVSKAGVCHMYATRVSIIYQMLAMGLLTNGYEDIVQEHFSDIAILLGSCSDIVSGDVVTRLKKIVLYIKRNEKDEEFREVDPTKGIDWLKVNCPQAAKELDVLLKEHGHRCIQEMDFISEPWSLRPHDLISTLQIMMVAPKSNNSNKSLNVEETVAQLKTPKKRFTKWILKKVVPLSRKAVVRRELTKSIFVLAYRRLGKLMVLEGYLPSEDLIFFLTQEEIGKLLTDHDTALVQKASRRKRIFPQLKKLEYPEINTGLPTPAKNDVDIAVDEKSEKIQGTPVCGGSVLNRACVITDLSEIHSLKQGDILITHATDIAWSPYFPLLSGIVTELGGLISHGAVIAREYGLPCIIGAKKATQMFETGDTVLLTADTGVLQLVKKHD
ncbi:hypothetical protein E2986_02164 [Frieseomelitta varia]|uniref:Phosphoenolpyruvate synthase n=1 Tax=Frieseomelitta varia TaxID=561572 RepID=A0A833SBY3_9HYME|nr:hypothetical protein E2986_02164 [Frieseomelitta varia]